MNPSVEFLSPSTMPPTQGYSQVAHVKGGELIFLSGQVGLDVNGKLVGDDYASQLEQVFRNIQAALIAVGATLDHLIKLNFYVSGALAIEDIVADHLAIRDRYINTDAPPASAFVIVNRLARAEWLLECEAIAVKP